MLKTEQTDIEAIRARIQQKRESYLKRNADGALDVWLKDPRVCVFDLGTTPQYFGWDALYTTTHEMVDGSTGPFEIDFGTPTVMASGDLGCSWQILRVIAQQKSGRTTDITVRQTDIWNKVDGRWYIVHEHNSLPMAEGESEALLSISDETMGLHPGPS